MLAYRLVFSLVALPMLMINALRRGETWADLGERFGGGAQATAALWVHGASNGEMTSARPAIARLLAAHPRLRLVVTTNTISGRAMVAGWGEARITARLAPVDLRWCLHRFLARHDPGGVLMVENELWPNRLDLLRRMGRPVAVIGARLSPRSAARWRKHPAFVQRLLSGLGLVSPQSAGDAARLASLNLPEGVLVAPVMLKAAVTLAPPNPADHKTLAAQFHRGATVLAASTHPGEEAAVIAGFAAARKRRPGLRLILAPRHPARGGEVSTLLSQAGLVHVRRSSGALPGPHDPVYLADTLGEMALWYSLAGTCFVGGSLVAKGGHTPFEPAAQGCAILHGPDVANFTEAYATLHQQRAALEVADGPALGRALAQLSPEQSKALGQAGRDALGTAAAQDGLRALIPQLARFFDLPS